ncbi:polyprenyl synthetase family protein [Mycobacterium sp. 236(2023)]|uniref:polyprenyl synthetase family protein n=1 Tax=Mycobacterium sp. 236(2023) TaxID=3038163 RepID=UPI0024150E58|nr:polyprenyl synthetase family protein [Mycobacterium sp. 236(2023)]MDG4665805.1 polyprenyl synthetase family protein [Mycobacterium sp. 236(2023)]
MVRESVLAAVAEFLDTRCAQSLPASRVDIAQDVLRALLAEGKCLRSTFLYLGWLSGAEADVSAIRAAASLEFLHAFALVQDDVMDGSPMRRGRPSAHRAFEGWHHRHGMAGSSARFGESAAILLGDLCLVWAEQMLRESGLAQEALTRAWPRYDAMRTELAVGQFADLVNDSSAFPTLDDVLDVARRKSGNYTVRRPLEIGAALSGCDERTLDALGDYGVAVGEAFQLRDDLLGVFGRPETTGKPAGSDLAARKATTVVVAAHQLSSRSQRRDLERLMTTADLSGDDITAWQRLIAEIGTMEWMEQLIDRRLAWALHRLDTVSLDDGVRSALITMASACTERVA